MLDPADAEPLPETLEAIECADLITVGPGSLFTSLITNLLVKGVPEALASSKAVRVFVCNLMTQANESLNLTASQHIERIYEHAHRPIFDYALVNTAPVSRVLLDRYAGEGASPIVADIEAIEALGVRCIAGDFAAEGDVLRHAADRVADAVLRLGAAEDAGNRIHGLASSKGTGRPRAKALNCYPERSRGFENPLPRTKSPGLARSSATPRL